MAEVLVTVGPVRYVAVLGRVVTGNTHGELFAESDIRRGDVLDQAVLPDVGFDETVGGPVKRRPLGVHAERAANGIASEQEALRPAQYFRALEVVKARNNRAVATFVKVVLEECC